MVNQQLVGFDVEEVREKVGAAADFARSGKGPVLLEIITYRHRGHSMSDPAKYRTKEELEEKKLSDPLLITAKKLQDKYKLSEEDLTAINAEIDAQAQAAYDFAENSPDPDLKDLYNYVYAPNAE